MAEYRYNYPDPNRKRRTQKNHDLASWLVPVFLLWTAPPIGILLLLLKLFDGTGRRKHSQSSRQEQPLGARTTTKPSAPKSTQTAKTSAGPAPSKAAPGKAMTVVGAILTAIFGFLSIVVLVDSLWVLPDVLWLLDTMVVPLCFLGGSAGLLWCGLRRQKQARRFRKYLALIGKRKKISISALAEAMPAVPATVRRDLEDMLDSGLFPAGYLDYGEDELVLSDAGLEEDPPKQEETPAAPSGEEDAVLAEIRALNNSIAHEALSAQIERIEEITSKIFDYQKTHPEKASQLRTFLGYYLPATLKILHAYARLESQGVEGENITAAMGRIEDMMSKVVEGFEKQLDQLFQSDAMDITTDVAVLERMLSKDGLSSGDALQLEL